MPATSQPSYALLRSPRFLPLFLTQFLGAFNDNLFKNALVILIAYRLASEQGLNAQVLVTLAAGLFILPFFLFSATAGQLADKYEKAKLIRLIKLAEIAIMVVAAAGFSTQSVTLLLAALFLMGTHSAFFGPLKYAILPDHLKESELITGNAYIEGGTFLAILLGTILGGVLVLQEAGAGLVSGGVLLAAITGYAISRFVPPAGPAAPNLHISLNFPVETWRILRYSAKQRDVFLAILGISWFWLIGATFLAQFPTFAKDVLHASEGVVTLFLTVFSIGIGLGSLMCNRLLKGKIHATYVPAAALGITLFTVDLYFASQQPIALTEGMLLGAGAFLSDASGWRILADMLAIAVCGGIYIVPLYAIMQSRASASHRARTVASNNVMNALFMVASAILTLLLLQLGFSVTHVFLAIAVANLAVAFIICRLLPDALIKSLVKWLFKLVFRVEVKHLEHFQEAGERVVIVANHTSLLDAGLLAAFLPDKLLFAVNTHVAQKWWMKPLMALVDAYPLDPTRPMATKALIEKIRRENRKCMIFPEGRITVTGSLMKIYEGPGMIADKAHATLLPVRIDGAQYSRFSYLKGKLRQRWFPRITITVLPPQDFQVDENIKGRRRRQIAGRQLYDVMTQMMFESSQWRLPLFWSLLNARAVHGGRHLIAEDIERRKISYDQLIARVFTLGRRMAKATEEGDYVGLLLPNMASTVVSFFALQGWGRVPAMLNFSTGAHHMLTACKAAQISVVYTSWRFVQAAKLEEAIEKMRETGISVYFLEDVRKRITWLDMLYGWLANRFAERAYLQTLSINRRRLGQVADNPAVVLFTSGSEGTPKGVVLSHANIQANCFQLASRVDFGPQDIVFNAMPVFHSFGLTGGMILPMLSGIRVFLYPSPLHYRIVPELTYDINATILFGTDTFLSGYARHAHPYDFHSVRYVFAGAEKLKEHTRKTWSEKFGVRIFEGYGTTETSPVIATNTPMHNKPGTVGRLLPAIRTLIEPVEEIERGGRLVVSGPNVMRGYLLADKPGLLQPPVAGWYDTGDIIAMDEEGYITILGRTKRFAKIAGEMVSLAAVESHAAALWQDRHHAAISLADEKRGEQVILVTTQPGAAREDLLTYARQIGVSEILLPRQIIVVETMALLGTGKVDYQAVKKWAEGKVV